MKPAVPKKPSSVRTGFAGSIPAPTMAADNMSAIKTADMTFKMPPAWHAEFKATAAIHGMSMKDLLVEAFDAWKEKKKAGLNS
jgi:hypothetical protein